eukprot:SAG22_NODE_10763_length_517_cov_0.861244_1_plen_64_part_00
MLSLQHLKVEGPGADSDTTNGAEPSFMHSADDQPNVLRGYEQPLTALLSFAGPPSPFLLNAAA